MAWTPTPARPPGQLGWRSPIAAQGIVATGIPSSETFGTPTMTVGPAPVLISLTGIPSAQAFGTATITPGPVGISLTGIPSAQAFGTATIAGPAPQIITLTGIPSTEAFGTATVSTVFTPASIAGLGLWLDAKAITGTSDGTAVATWTDASGQARNATAMATAPVYRAAGLNNQPAIEFVTTADNRYQIAGLATALSGATQYTICYVAALRTFTQSPIVLTAPSNAAFQFMIQFSDSTHCYWAHTSTNYRQVTTPAGVGPPGYLSFVRDTTPSAHTYLSSGADCAFSAVGSSGDMLVPVASLSGDAIMGGYYDSTSCRWDGFISEILFYNRALTATERGNVENYLKNKWFPIAPTGIASAEAFGTAAITGGGGPITFDAVANATPVNNGATAFNWTHTITAGAGVLVLVSSWGASGMVPTAKVGSTAMTRLGSLQDFFTATGTYLSLHVFGLTAAPGGAQTINVTFPSASQAAMASQSYKGVTSFGTPVTASGTAAPITVAATAAANKMIANIFSAYAPTTLASYTQTQRYTVNVYSYTNLATVTGDAAGTGSATSFTTTISGGSLSGWGGIAVPMT